ncbi:MAG TPA: SAF domain-containing protein [Candidatus Dormibacteraeota bacterium]|nr:SAF domain-containing protein [Candidatus Dormibacteraeota bacterium]
MKRWATALLALAVGGGVSAALLMLANPDRDAVEVYAAARDIRVGSNFAPDSMVLVRVNASGLPPLLFRRGDGSRLAALLATHDLAAGQLIQRTDARSRDSIGDRRLVFIPVKDALPVAPGSKVDLLVVDGSLDHVSVSPFALGVEVRASAPGGLVLVVSSRQAPAFVYASTVLRLTAVIAEPGTANGAEGAVSTPEQAVAVAGEP